MELLRQINVPEQNSVNFKANLDLEIIFNNNIDDPPENKENNKFDLANFKIEPIKEKESFMLTALNRNKFVDDNLLKDQDDKVNPNSIYNENEVNKQNIENNEFKENEKEKENFMTKPNNLNKLNVIDENNNANTSVMNNSKLRLKNLMHSVVDALSSGRSSAKVKEDKKYLKLGDGLNQLIDRNPNFIFKEKLKKEIDGEKILATENLINKKNVNEQKEAEENKVIRKDDSDNIMKNCNEIEKSQNDKQEKPEKTEKITKIQFNEDKNEVVIHEKNEENSNDNNHEKSVISEANHIKENQEKVDLNLSKVSIKSKQHPVLRKKRSSCQKVN
jgi:hypothetical protein